MRCSADKQDRQALSVYWRYRGDDVLQLSGHATDQATTETRYGLISTIMA